MSGKVIWDIRASALLMGPRRKIWFVVLGLVLLTVVALVSYVILSMTATNDDCLGLPLLEPPNVGLSSARVNVSVYSSIDHPLVNLRAEVFVNDASVGELNPLADGISGGPMTFHDVDMNGRLTSDDYFLVETIPGNRYRLDLYAAPCTFPSVQTWTT